VHHFVFLGRGFYIYARWFADTQSEQGHVNQPTYSADGEHQQAGLEQNELLNRTRLVGRRSVQAQSVRRNSDWQKKEANAKRGMNSMPVTFSASIRRGVVS